MAQEFRGTQYLYLARAHLLDARQPFARGGFLTLVVNQQDLVVRIARVLKHAHDTTLRHRQIVFDDNDQGYRRLFAVAILDPVLTRMNTVQLRVLIAPSLKMPEYGSTFIRAVT